jgi:hypothetical protein
MPTTTATTTKKKATTSVAFSCACPQSIVEVTVQRASNPSQIRRLRFQQTGSKTLRLASGLHFLDCRAIGTPGTDFSLTVTDGGDMVPIDRTLPPSGTAGENRDLDVE